MDEVAQVGPVLREDRPVKTEPARDRGDGVGRRLPARDRARDVVRRDIEHDEDERRDHPQHDEAKEDAAHEEARHRALLKSRSPRGSSASRMLSPSRLNESVAASRKMPGKSSNHQATW